MSVSDPYKVLQVDPEAEREVIEAAYKGEYGNYVRIRHRGGLETAYAHLVRFSVKAGDCVGAEARIGDLGSTGLVAGPHLHFEVLRDGAPIDPLAVLGKDLP